MFDLMYIVEILISILIVVGLILLQIFLSKRKTRFLGLLLPIITFIIPSMRILFSYENSATGTTLGGFLVANIPTAVFVVIYFVCRRKMSSKKQLDKMNIQDLN